MRTCAASTLCRAGVLFAVLVLPIVARAAPPAAADGSQKRVLVVYTTRRDTEFSIAGDQMIPRLLAQKFEKPDYYAEYIDGARFAEPRYETAFLQYLKLKYGAAHFDVVIAAHALSYRFVTAHRDELFPGVPIVFLSEEAGTRRVANSAGVLVVRDFRPTLAMALMLQPETREVVIVCGHSARDAAMERMAHAQLESFAPAIRFIYVSDLSTDALEARLASLPPHTIIYYLLFYQDALGTNVNPLEYLDRLAAVANRPIYSWVDSTIGRGVVGGSLQSVRAEVQAVADVAIEVLAGADVDALPLLSKTLSERQIDWRQLRRWDIREIRVPAGTRILFRPPGIWERYRRYVLGAAAVFLVQSALIAVLLHQRNTLQRADQRIRRNEAALRTSYHQLRDLGSRLLAAQDAERSRIARELHDDISQQLSVLSFNLQILGGSGPQHDEDVEAVAREALDRLDRISGSLHDLSHRLHPAKLRLMGLVPAIDGLRHDLSRPDLAVTFSHRDVPATLPHDLTIPLFRVVQEALRNAVDHSRGRAVQIDLTRRAGHLVLTIADDGVGFEVESAWARGLGLISMRERVEPIGGTLAIQSAPGRGTRLEIIVPVDEALRAAPLAV